MLLKYIIYLFNLMKKLRARNIFGLEMILSLYMLLYIYIYI